MVRLVEKPELLIWEYGALVVFSWWAKYVGVVSIVNDAGSFCQI